MKFGKRQCHGCWKRGIALEKILFMRIFQIIHFILILKVNEATK